MSSKRKKLALVAVIVITVLGLLVVVLRTSPANYWVTPGELKAQGAAGQQVRVAGQVVNNSWNWDEANNRLLFKMRAPGEKEVLPVVYKGIVPDSFQNLSKVIVEGTPLADGSFEARTVLIRCPENYMVEKAVGSAFQALKIEGTLYR